MEIETYFKLKPLNKLKISNGAIVNLIKWIGHININASLTCECLARHLVCVSVQFCILRHECLCVCVRARAIQTFKARCWVHAPSRPTCTSVFTRPWRLQTHRWLASLRWTIPPPPHLKIVTIFWGVFWWLFVTMKWRKLITANHFFITDQVCLVGRLQPLSCQCHGGDSTDRKHWLVIRKLRTIRSGVQIFSRGAFSKCNTGVFWDDSRKV